MFSSSVGGLVLLRSLLLLDVTMAENCCFGAFAPNGGCFTNSSLRCVDDVDGCQKCRVSDSWTPSVRCTSCCVEAFEDECSDSTSATGVIGIISLVLVLFTCACCSGVVLLVERRRRLRPSVEVLASSTQSPLAEATLDEEAVAEEPKDDDGDVEATDMSDMPVAREQTLTQGYPVGTTPLELGQPISRAGLLEE